MDKCINLTDLYKVELLAELTLLFENAKETGNAVYITNVDGIVKGTLKILDNMATRDILDLLINVRTVNGKF